MVNPQKLVYSNKFGIQENVTIVWGYLVLQQTCLAPRVVFPKVYSEAILFDLHI
jgi:hypothetical protein